MFEGNGVQSPLIGLCDCQGQSQVSGRITLAHYKADIYNYQCRIKI